LGYKIKEDAWASVNRFPLQLGFSSGQHVEFVVDKAALGQVFSEYFGFP
jgi:hypothetical protein